MLLFRVAHAKDQRHSPEPREGRVVRDGGTFRALQGVLEGFMENVAP